MRAYTTWYNSSKQDQGGLQQWFVDDIKTSDDIACTSDSVRAHLRCSKSRIYVANLLLRQKSAKIIQIG